MPTIALNCRQRVNDDGFVFFVGCIFVIVCSVIILLDTEKTVAKYVDPIMSLASAGSLLLLSYPYSKRAAAKELRNTIGKKSFLFLENLKFVLEI